MQYNPLFLKIIKNNPLASGTKRQALKYKGLIISWYYITTHNTSIYYTGPQKIFTLQTMMRCIKTG